MKKILICFRNCLEYSPKKLLSKMALEIALKNALENALQIALQINLHWKFKKALELAVMVF